MVTACAALCRAKEMVILGTQYAGEMKKGIFTVMHYLMPKRGILSLHSGCNVGKNDDVTLFFGLSGVITTLSCKPHGNHDIRCEQAPVPSMVTDKKTCLST